MTALENGFGLIVPLCRKALQKGISEDVSINIVNWRKDLVK